MTKIYPIRVVQEAPQAGQRSGGYRAYMIWQYLDVARGETLCEHLALAESGARAKRMAILACKERCQAREGVV